MKVRPEIVLAPAFPDGLVKVTCQTCAPWLVVGIVASFTREEMVADSPLAVAMVISLNEMVC